MAGNKTCLPWLCWVSAIFYCHVGLYVKQLNCFFKMLVSDMTTVMTILLRIIIGCLRGVCRCCPRLPFRLLLTTITKHVRSLSAFWHMLLLSTAITTAVLYSLRISFIGLQRSTETCWDHVTLQFSFVLENCLPHVLFVLFKNDTICFYKGLHKSSAYIYLIF